MFHADTCWLAPAGSELAGAPPPTQSHISVILITTIPFQAGLCLVDRIRWRPEIGDPTVIGWLTVAAYALAGVACWRAARRVDTPGGRTAGDWHKWLVMTALMAGLCLNKQLDLQSLLTDIGRVVAHQQGWYSERRAFQKVVVLGTLAAASVAAMFLLVRFYRFWAKNFLLGCGVAILAGFVAVRAISFHHVDTLLRTTALGVKMNAFLELAGIVLVGLAAWNFERRAGREPAYSTDEHSPTS